jgi:hypothetical protein
MQSCETIVLSAEVLHRLNRFPCDWKIILSRAFRFQTSWGRLWRILRVESFSLFSRILLDLMYTVLQSASRSWVAVTASCFFLSAEIALDGETCFFPQTWIFHRADVTRKTASHGSVEFYIYRSMSKHLHRRNAGAVAAPTSNSVLA